MSLDAPACFLLQPDGPFRFGGHPEDLTRARPLPGADTLFGALMWAASALSGPDGADAWLAPFLAGDPPFLLSSALPLEPGTGTVYLPKPYRRPPGVDEAVTDPKRLKDVSYIEAGLAEWYKGSDPASDPVADGELLRAQMDGDTPLWESTIRPGVTLDRATSASQVYAVRSVSYRCNLAVYVMARDTKTTDDLERLLQVLSATGIGGGRSRGYGRFSVQRSECDLPLSARPRGMALSPVWPREEDLSSGALNAPAGAGYRVIERNPWIASPVWGGARARTVAMIGEGSYLSPTLDAPVGGMADVTPEERAGPHPIYRYGYGMFLDEGEA